MSDSSWHEIFWWHKEICFVWPVEWESVYAFCSKYKYLEFNLLDFRLISEANWYFSQRCFRILIKCWVVYQSSKSMVLVILSASLLYSRPTQKRFKFMLWSIARLKMFKARLWVCVLLLLHFIIWWVAKLSVYQKMNLFSNCLIEKVKKIG